MEANNLNQEVCELFGIDSSQCSRLTVEFAAGRPPKATADIYKPTDSELIDLLAKYKNLMKKSEPMPDSEPAAETVRIMGDEVKKPSTSWQKQDFDIFHKTVSDAQKSYSEYVVHRKNCLYLFFAFCSCALSFLAGLFLGDL
jgi:hypothetical protein